MSDFHEGEIIQTSQPVQNERTGFVIPAGVVGIVRGTTEDSKMVIASVDAGAVPAPEGVGEEEWEEFSDITGAFEPHEIEPGELPEDPPTWLETAVS